MSQKGTTEISFLRHNFEKESLIFSTRLTLWFTYQKNIFIVLLLDSAWDFFMSEWARKEQKQNFFFLKTEFWKVEVNSHSKLQFHFFCLYNIYINFCTSLLSNSLFSLQFRLFCDGNHRRHYSSYYKKWNWSIFFIKICKWYNSEFRLETESAFDLDMESRIWAVLGPDVYLQNFA